jgi:hypothetical protein
VKTPVGVLNSAVEEAGMDQEAVRELARLIADEVIPAEAEEFDSRADAWFADPHRAGAHDADGGGPLGFGFAEVATNAVPAVLYIAEHILAATTEMTAEEGIRRATDWLGRKKKKKDKPAEEPPTAGLDVQEIAAAYDRDPDAVRRAVLAAGEEYGADAALIEKIADLVPALLDL